MKKEGHSLVSEKQQITSSLTLIGCRQKEHSGLCGKMCQAGKKCSQSDQNGNVTSCQINRQQCQNDNKQRQHDNKLRHFDEKNGQVMTSDENLSRGKNKTIQIISHGAKYYYVDTFNLVWVNLYFFIVLNLVSIYSYGVILVQVLSGNPTTTYTYIYSMLITNLAGLGITAGCHRLWAHKSYNASFNLRLFLMIAQSVAGQNSIYTWSRDHRVHHKFSDTDADPHNVRRGFFFSHMGWLLRRKHPELVKKSSGISFADLLSDPIVQFQHDHYTILYFIFALILPVAIPIIGWGETLLNSFLLAFVFRYNLGLHSTWFVNSAAHMFGNRPYNLDIRPSENIYVSFGALGEGYHNYHHTFPMDYATSEDGGASLNLTKNFIDLMALFGAAWDLKKMGKLTVDGRKEKVKMDPRCRS